MSELIANIKFWAVVFAVIACIAVLGLWAGIAAGEIWAGISVAGSIASIVALFLALREWQRVKKVRVELEEQRAYFKKLHFLTNDLRQLREHQKKLDYHRSQKQWEQAGRQMRACLGNLEAMRTRLDESARRSHDSLVTGIYSALEKLQLSEDDDRAPTTPVFKVIGDLDGFAVLVNNALEEHHWRQMP